VTAETITPNDDVAALSDRELLERIFAVVRALEPLTPHVDRLQVLLDPGAAMRRHWRRGKADAVPQSAPAPFHVGEASEDSPQVGT
jgi:hypothetical protein